VKKRKGLLFIVIFTLIVLVDLQLFGMSLLAFAWHVRHGFHREVHGIKFRVPLFYQESEDSTLNQFSIHAFPSDMHREDSAITVSFPPWTSEMALDPLSKEDAERMGLVLIAQRHAKLGNRSGSCAEYLQDDLDLGGRLSGLGPTEIECRFHNVEVRFTGSRNAVPEFYSFIESAKEVNR